jgi:type I restriction enzyme S subunit
MNSQNSLKNNATTKNTQYTKNLSELSALGGLPSGWSWVKLGDVARIVYGKGLPTKNLLKKGFPVFGANGIIGFFNRYLYEEPQVLISCRGAYSGKINFSPERSFITNNSLVVEILGEEKLSKKFLYYALVNTRKDKLVTGTAQPQVTINNAVELEIPLPPLTEQKKIVEKIEELFSQLDSGVAALKKAKEQIRLYRQSVLAAAFSGRLNQDLSDYKMNRIKEKNKSGKFLNPENPQIPVNHGSDNLPNGWKWVKLGDVCETTSGGTPSRKNPKYFEGKISWFKSGELNYNVIKDSEEKITSEAIENSSAKIFPKGTLLIALYGATVGRLAFLGIDAATNQAVAAIYPTKNLSNKYLYWYLFSYREKLLEQRIGGANQILVKEL